MKKSTHNHYESVEKQHYKKKYLERKLDERAAEREIRTYSYIPTSEVPEAPDVDEERTM